MIIKNIQQHVAQVLIRASEEKGVGGWAKEVKDADAWITDKRRHNSSQEYVNQLEKNVIYLREASYGVSQVLTRLFCDGEPRLVKDDKTIIAFIQGVKVYFGRLEFGRYYKYLTTGVRFGDFDLDYFVDDTVQNIQNKLDLKVVVIPDKSFLEPLRGLRISSNPGKYIDELEFSCLFWQTYLSCSTKYLYYFLLNSDRYGKCFQDADKREVFITINSFFYQNTVVEVEMYRNGMADRTPEAVKILKEQRKKWWEFWK